MLTGAPKLRGRGWQGRVPAFSAKLFACLGHLAECLTWVPEHIAPGLPPLFLFTFGGSGGELS